MIICTLLSLYMVAILLRVVMSWFPITPGTPVASAFSFLHRITDPVLGPIRRLMSPVGGVIDFSPMIVMFILVIIRSRFC